MRPAAARSLAVVTPGEAPADLRRSILVLPELRRRGGARPIRFEELLTRREIQQQPRAPRSGRDTTGRFAAPLARKEA
jgi:hypothetical protein